VSAVYLSANPVQHRRTKHIELDIHFVREKMALGACECYMYPPVLSLLTSSLRDYRLSYFMNFDPVFTSAKHRVQTAGAC
jgi:hypothetical protein